MFIRRKEGQTYDAWLHWAVTTKCNLNCEYCFHNSPQKKQSFSHTTYLRDLAKYAMILGMSIPVLFRNLTLRTRKKSVQAVDIGALTKTLDNTGKLFRISFTGGGEPFLVPNLTETCVQLTKKHYISIDTNLTSDRVREFAQKVDPARVLFIIASLHIKELEKHNMLDKYIENFLFCKSKGFNIVAIEVGHPSLIPDIEKYREYFRQKGVLLQFSPFCGTYKNNAYPEAYTQQELEKLGIDLADTRIFYRHNHLCNAGYNAGIVSASGNVYPCFQMKKYIGNIYDVIRFRDKPVHCPFKYCGCPLSVYDPYLFEKLAQPKQGQRT